MKSFQLSLMPGQYHKTVFDIEGRFNKAFFGEEEIRRRKEKACQERRNNRMLKERHRWALLPNTVEFYEVDIFI